MKRTNLPRSYIFQDGFQLLVHSAGNDRALVLIGDENLLALEGVDDVRRVVNVL